MLRREKFVPDEYYHVYNRIVRGAPGFRDERSCERLLQAFLIANSTESSQAFQYLRDNKNVSVEKALEITRRGEKIVDVLCYAIMPDHYHLLLKERLEGGVTKFIGKCNVSIAKYINIKNNRKGPLFESNFKAKHIDSNEYLLHLSLYIHLNPLDIISGSGRAWREGELKNWPGEKKKLINYPWSSLRAFLDDNYEDEIISGTEIIFDQFKSKKEYEKFLQNWSWSDTIDS